MEISLRKEVVEKMAVMEAADYKPRVSTAQMVAFLDRLDTEKRINVKAIVDSPDLRRLAYGKMSEKMYGFIETKDGKEYSNEGKLYISGTGDAMQVSILSRYHKEEDLSQYKGHAFTPEERNNLYTNGQAGAVIELDVNYGKEGMEPRLEKCFVSYDRDLNRFKALPTDKIGEQAFSQFYGRKLDEKQTEALKAGKPITIDLPAKDGTMKKNVLQFDTYEFGLKQYPLAFFAPRKLCGVELTSEQRTALGQGKEVEIHGMQRKDGSTFTSKVKLGEHANLEFVNNRKKELSNKAVPVVLDPPKKKARKTHSL